MKIDLPSDVRRFLDAEVKRGRFAGPGEVVATALRRMEKAQAGVSFANLGDLVDGDVMALAFIVMMEAARSAREDLRAIMDGVKAINAAKHALRELAARVNRDVARNSCRAADARALDFSRGLGSERAYHRVELPHLDPDAPGGVRFAAVDLFPRSRISRPAELGAVLDSVRDKLDSLSEMGEMESLRMQMAMDRLSRMMSTLSNLLKKIAETQEAITQNIK